MAYNPLEQYSLGVEQRARNLVPYAGNQSPDLLADPDTLSRHELTRFMNGNILGGNQGANDNFLQPFNALSTSLSAQCYHGGMCNEYSALAFEDQMRNPWMSGVPITRYWSNGMGHSFTAQGDARDPRLRPVVSDPWTMDREPEFLDRTMMAQINDANIVSTWQDRMPGEGALEANRFRNWGIPRLRQAEQNPQVQNQMVQLWNANRGVQQNMIQQLLGGQQVPGVYNHRTNRV